MGWEADILLYIQEYIRSDFFNPVMTVFTHTGDYGIFVMDEATNIVGISTYPDEVRDRSSVLTVDALQFPLLFQQSLGGDFHIVLGGSMNWNVSAKCNTHYKINKTTYDVSYRGIKQHKITFDVMGALSFDGLAIYCRFSPSNMFKQGFGPEIKNTWTLGGAVAL